MNTFLGYLIVISDKTEEMAGTHFDGFIHHEVPLINAGLGGGDGNDVSVKERQLCGGVGEGCRVHEGGAFRPLRLGLGLSLLHDSIRFH